MQYSDIACVYNESYCASSVEQTNRLCILRSYMSAKLKIRPSATDDLNVKFLAKHSSSDLKSSLMTTMCHLTLQNSFPPSIKVTFGIIWQWYLEERKESTMRMMGSCLNTVLIADFVRKIHSVCILYIYILDKYANEFSTFAIVQSALKVNEQKKNRIKDRHGTIARYPSRIQSGEEERDHIYTEW